MRHVGFRSCGPHSVEFTKDIYCEDNSGFLTLKRCLVKLPRLLTPAVQSALPTPRKSASTSSTVSPRVRTHSWRPEYHRQASPIPLGPKRPTEAFSWVPLFSIVEMHVLVGQNRIFIIEVGLEYGTNQKKWYINYKITFGPIMARVSQIYNLFLSFTNLNFLHFSPGRGAQLSCPGFLGFPGFLGLEEPQP